MSYPLHFVLESFFHGLPSRHLLSKSVRLHPFMEYTTNDISITFWRPIFSQVLSPENFCLCKSTIIVTSSSLLLVPQLESPIRIQKYVPLYNWTDLDDTGIIQISNLCFYLILNLLGGAYWGCVA